jgi:Flp pilus assembly protein TadB
MAAERTRHALLSRTATEAVDNGFMKRRLGMRDRLAWFVAVIAVGIVLYVVLPVWILIVAVVVIISVPLLLRLRRRQLSRR